MTPTQETVAVVFACWGMLCFTVFVGWKVVSYLIVDSVQSIAQGEDDGGSKG